MPDLTYYEPCRPHLRTGDLLQWSSSSALGWLIRKVTSSKVNHTGMVVRFTEYEGDQNAVNRRFTLEALENGIALNLISRRFESYEGKCYWYPLLPIYGDKRSLLGSAALKYSGVKYDYRSLFKNILGKVSANAKKLFCSEYVYLSFKDCGFTTDLCKSDKLLIKLAEGKSPVPGDMPLLNWWSEGVRIF